MAGPKTPTRRHGFPSGACGPAANNDAWACDEGGADGDDDAWAAICASLSGDAAATDLGTAFHRLAQYAVIRREGGRLARPSDERVTAICRSCGLAAGQRARLEAALGRWFGSSVATRVAGCANVRAEVPFFQIIDDEGAPVYLEGEIDLLAIGAAGSGEALVVDYKTGGRPDEDPAHLHEKHLLQATCYAYVVLCQGYEAVEAVFVRVERQDPDDPAGAPVRPLPLRRRRARLSGKGHPGGLSRLASVGGRKRACALPAANSIAGSSASTAAGMRASHGPWDAAPRPGRSLSVGGHHGAPAARRAGRMSCPAYGPGRPRLPVRTPHGDRGLHGKPACRFPAWLPATPQPGRKT